MKESNEELSKLSLNKISSTLNCCHLLVHQQLNKPIETNPLHLLKQTFKPFY